MIRKMFYKKIYLPKQVISVITAAAFLWFQTASLFAETFIGGANLKSLYVTNKGFLEKGLNARDGLLTKYVDGYIDFVYYIAGDANHDGKIDELDAIKTTQYEYIENTSKIKRIVDLVSGKFIEYGDLSSESWKEGSYGGRSGQWGALREYQRKIDETTKEWDGVTYELIGEYFYDSDGILAMKKIYGTSVQELDLQVLAGEIKTKEAQVTANNNSISYYQNPTKVVDDPSCAGAKITVIDTAALLVAPAKIAALQYANMRLNLEIECLKARQIMCQFGISSDLIQKKMQLLNYLINGVNSALGGDITITGSGGENVDEASASLKDVQAQILALQADLFDLQGKLNALNRTGANTSGMTKTQLENAIATKQKSISAAVNLLTAELNERQNEIREEVSLENTLNSLNSAISSLDSTISDLTTTITDLNTLITYINNLALAGSYASEIAGLNLSISDIQQYLSNVGMVREAEIPELISLTKTLVNLYSQLSLAQSCSSSGLNTSTISSQINTAKTRLTALGFTYNSGSRNLSGSSANTSGRTTISSIISSKRTQIATRTSQIAALGCSYSNGLNTADLSKKRDDLAKKLGYKEKTVYQESVPGCSSSGTYIKVVDIPSVDTLSTRVTSLSSSRETYRTRRQTYVAQRDGYVATLRSNIAKIKLVRATFTEVEEKIKQAELALQELQSMSVKASEVQKLIIAVKIWLLNKHIEKLKKQRDMLAETIKEMEKDLENEGEHYRTENGFWSNDKDRVATSIILYERCRDSAGKLTSMPTMEFALYMKYSDEHDEDHDTDGDGDKMDYEETWHKVSDVTETELNDREFLRKLIEQATQNYRNEINGCQSLIDENGRKIGTIVSRMAAIDIELAKLQAEYNAMTPAQLQSCGGAVGNALQQRMEALRAEKTSLEAQVTELNTEIDAARETIAARTKDLQTKGFRAGSYKINGKVVVVSKAWNYLEAGTYTIDGKNITVNPGERKILSCGEYKFEWQSTVWTETTTRHTGCGGTTTDTEEHVRWDRKAAVYTTDYDPEAENPTGVFLEGAVQGVARKKVGTYQYDNWGRLISSTLTDINGTRTTNYFDKYGRVVKSITVGKQFQEVDSLSEKSCGGEKIKKVITLNVRTETNYVYNDTLETVVEGRTVAPGALSKTTSRTQTSATYTSSDSIQCIDNMTVKIDTDSTTETTYQNGEIFKTNTKTDSHTDTTTHENAGYFILRVVLEAILTIVLGAIGGIVGLIIGVVLAAIEVIVELAVYFGTGAGTKKQSDDETKRTHKNSMVNSFYEGLSLRPPTEPPKKPDWGVGPMGIGG